MFDGVGFEDEDDSDDWLNDLILQIPPEETPDLSRINPVTGY